MSKSERKLAMREEAKRKVKPASSVTPGTDRGYRQEVEHGRQRLLRDAAVEGDVLARKVKSELNYLINNYLPQYDARIAQLIDQWRRSGDPSYDPGIRVKVRNARKEYMSKGRAL